MSELLIRDDDLQEEQENRPAFVVTNDRQAEWCLQQIKQKQEELETWTEHYKMLTQQITDKLNDDIAYFSAHLEGYLLDQIDSKFIKATKTQVSYTLPSGKLVLKHQEPEYKPNDEILIPWLEKNNPSLIKVKRTADWAGLKKTLTLDGTDMLTEDGEIVPGITVTPRDDVFKVEVKKNGKR